MVRIRFKQVSENLSESVRSFYGESGKYKVAIEKSGDSYKYVVTKFDSGGLVSLGLVVSQDAESHDAAKAAAKEALKTFGVRFGSDQRRHVARKIAA